MVAPADIAADLAAEHAALDALLGRLDEPAWDTPTPAPGWSVRDQVSHLTYFDRTAALALTDPSAFAAHLAADGPALSAGGDGPDVALGRALTPGRLLDQWRRGRAVVLAALAAADPSTRVPWYGPAMSPVSFGSARIMETWAHGTDVADAVGDDPTDSPRLRHVLHLGVRARAYAFAVHHVADPGTAVGVEAVASDGSVWTFGDPADQWLRGPALDLALVFTQRRHPAATAVVADGDVAELWLGIAQAFAGPAGAGRPTPAGAADASTPWRSLR